MQIQKTEDYSIFKHTELNRFVQNAHANNLERIISKNNYLHLHPVLVNEQMEVIDGQHRIAVAKRLGLPIYYLVSDVKYEHILTANLYQKKLSSKDTISFYAIKDKNEHYIKLLHYMEALELNIKGLLSLIFGISTRKMLDLIKGGNFMFPSKDFDGLINDYLTFSSFVKERKISPMTMFKTGPFCLAFRNLCTSPSMTFPIFMKKVENQWYNLRPQATSKEWFISLLNIYNWKNQNPLALDAS